jgi:hypothetical protein
VKDFTDGRVHQQWWKTVDKHKKMREHHLHLAFHMTTGKDIRPFSIPTVLPVLEFEEWVK